MLTFHITLFTVFLEMYEKGEKKKGESGLNSEKREWGS